MTWEYRVLSVPEPEGTESGEWLEIVEVYYDENGKLVNRTVDSMKPCGETVEEVREALLMMLDATEKPVLREADVDAAFKGTGAPIYAEPREKK